KFGVEGTTVQDVVIGQNNINTTGSKYLIMGYDTTGNYASIMALEQSVAYRPLVLQRDGGNVGIGTVNPLSKLTVAGLASSTGTALVIDANGNIYKDSSSIRFKENLAPLESDFSKILTLTPYSFNFKETGASDIGYIAEDVVAAGLTDLVIYDNEGKPSSIKYNRIPLYTLELLKNQQTEIKTLSTTLENLTKETPFSKESPLTGTESSLSAENLTISGGSAQISETREILTDPTREINLIKTRLNVVETALGIGGTNPDVAATLVVANENELAGTSPAATPDWRDWIAQLQEIITTSTDNIAVDQNLILYKDLNVLGKTTVDELAVTGKMSVGLLAINGLDVAGVTLKTLAGDLNLQGLVKITKEGNVVIDTGVIIANSNVRDYTILPAGVTELKVQNSNLKTTSQNPQCETMQISGKTATAECAINWTVSPTVINTTPSYETTVWVENITNEGFTIKLGAASTEEQKVYWIAVW
ncbi:tail fiber domain-containing protein, partial [Patescibacteria group bacterium]|nr:tail fiber domain-containing protein [Patescibacteria group bacterium]